MFFFSFIKGCDVCISQISQIFWKKSGFPFKYYYLKRFICSVEVAHIVIRSYDFLVFANFISLCLNRKFRLRLVFSGLIFFQNLIWLRFHITNERKIIFLFHVRREIQHTGQCPVRRSSEITKLRNFGIYSEN